MRLVKLLPCLALLAGCLKGPGFMSQKAVTTSGRHGAAAVVEEIKATITGATATGHVKPADDKTQVMSAAPQSAIAGAQVAFPPGTVAVDTDITLAPGPSLANDAVAQQLGLGTGLQSSANAVTVQSSVPLDTAQPFTLAIPLPDNGNGLALGDLYANLIVLFTVKTADGQTITGIITRDSIKIEKSLAVVSTMHFGTFQAVFTLQPVTRAVQVAEAPAKTTPAARSYYFSGPATGSFGAGNGQRVGGFQAWVHKVSPAHVGGPTSLTVDRIETFKTTADAH